MKKSYLNKFKNKYKRRPLRIYKSSMLKPVTSPRKNKHKRRLLRMLRIYKSSMLKPVTSPRKNKRFLKNKSIKISKFKNRLMIPLLTSNKYRTLLKKKLHIVNKYVPPTFSKFFKTKTPSIKIIKGDVNRIFIWNTRLPVKFVTIFSDYLLLDTSTRFFVYTKNKFFCIDKLACGSILVLNNHIGTANTLSLHMNYRIGYYKALTTKKKTLPERYLISLYKKIYLRDKKFHNTNKHTTSFIFPKKRKQTCYKQERKFYIKHIIRLRYRWFFKPELAKFKLFKKRFKRSLKRFRKIKKNKLFVEKFRTNFSRLTGFKEKGLFKLWSSFRKSYNQYWSQSNAVLRFSQSLLLSPINFLVFLGMSSSLAASAYLVKSGAIAINGRVATDFTNFKPGDLMQLNICIWRAVRTFFSYQRWNNDFRSLSYLPFLYVDWSSLIFMMVRWPRKHELVAPSFLSERWVRYYIRLFPVKRAKFKKAKINLKTYNKIVNKQ